jgi:hypothetical protein
MAIKRKMRDLKMRSTFDPLVSRAVLLHEGTLSFTEFLRKGYRW